MQKTSKVIIKWYTTNNQKTGKLNEIYYIVRQNNKIIETGSWDRYSHPKLNFQYFKKRMMNTFNVSSFSLIQ
jgi:hypothetical protein